MLKKHIKKSNKLILIIGLQFVLCFLLGNSLSAILTHGKIIETNSTAYTSTLHSISKTKHNKISILAHFNRNYILNDQIPTKNEIIIETLIEETEGEPDDELIFYLGDYRSNIVQKLIFNYCTKKSWTLFNIHKSINPLNILFCVFRI